MKTIEIIRTQEAQNLHLLNDGTEECAQQLLRSVKRNNKKITAQFQQTISELSEVGIVLAKEGKQITRKLKPMNVTSHWNIGKL